MPDQIMPEMSMPEAGAPQFPNSPMAENADSAANPSDVKSRMAADMQQLKTKELDLHAKRQINQQKIQEMKVQLIQDLFEMLKSAGVDPSSLDSIQGFLQSLNEQDPDLATIFELAFSGLTGQGEQGPGMMGVPAPEGEGGGMQGLMGKYNNLAGPMMQGAPGQGMAPEMQDPGMQGPMPPEPPM